MSEDAAPYGVHSEHEKVVAAVKQSIADEIARGKGRGVEALGRRLCFCGDVVRETSAAIAGELAVDATAADAMPVAARHRIFVARNPDGSWTLGRERLVGSDLCLHWVPVPLSHLFDLGFQRDDLEGLVVNATYFAEVGALKLF